MSPASVPSLAENVESTLVDMIGLSPSCHSAANAAAPFRLLLGAVAMIAFPCALRTWRGLCTMPPPMSKK